MKGRSVLETFAGLSDETKDILSDLNSSRLLALAALSIADQKCGVERLSAENMSACLEAAGTAAKPLSLTRALANSQGRVSAQQNLAGETMYRLMRKGRREIEPLLGGSGLTVVRFDGKAPRSDRRRLGNVLNGLTGVVKISDPYYGVRTLDSLEFLPNTCEVRFLTGQTTESVHKVKGAFADFLKEHPSIEFRLAQNPRELHDRYVLNAKTLMIVGHGLKDVGSKESFIVRLDSGVARELVDQTERAFDDRWSTASKLVL